MKKKSFLYPISGMLMFFLITLAPVFGGEGMWLPLLLKSLNEAEMKSMGMKMSAEDIYSVNKGSLKDAVVHFGGFCTGEVISDQGLLLTNHHCGYDVIQSHSTLERNYLVDGFWAKSNAEELPTPGLFATFIVRIDDVTKMVLNGVRKDMSPTERQSRIDQNLKTVSNRAAKESWQDVFVRSFFEGNQYYLFVTETYRDVRLVGTPPESIGKFGADTDNWVWPRHTGDFALFRIYAGPDNKPAEYSAQNKPLTPRHFFPVSMDGVADGDFTLVFGFPGRTYQYLPSFAVAQTIDIIDPARIGVRDISLGIMDKHMRANPDVRLAYASKFASLSNAWKKWIGEVQGLKSTQAVKEKEKQEKDFFQTIGRNKKQEEKYQHLLPEMERLYRQLDPIVHDRFILTEVLGGSNVELFRLTSYADRLVRAFNENGEEGFRRMADRTLPVLEDFFKDYRVEIDWDLFSALTEHVATHMTPDLLPDILRDYTASPTTGAFDVLAGKVYSSSVLVTQSTFEEAVMKGGEGFASAMRLDSAYQFYLSLKQVLDQHISPVYNELNEQLNSIQRDYVTALMEAYPKRRFWPDANSTLRVSYGQVESYTPRDAVQYNTQTYLDGVMEKYKPGDYEFDVHPRLIELYMTRDYGPYSENGKMPVCFIASNHTTGGNSGSPAIDAHGNLIGINFDRVWEGTMSDLYYDKSICRNIMVDVRYILFIIDKFAGAGHLIQEMKLVHPKA